MIFISGGAGSIGSALVKHLASNGEKLVIYDSNEYGLFKLKSELGIDNITYVLGSLKDRENIENSLRSYSDIVIHLASLKNIAITEQNIRETIYSNIVGTLNLVEVALSKGVKKFITISSDKAVDFSSTYGATKFLQEKITLGANKYKQGLYSVLRMVNVMETRGNVWETWKNQEKQGLPLTVTDPGMKRRFIGIYDVIDYVEYIVENMKGGELFVTDTKETNMIEIAQSISKNIKIVGIREGEKMSENIMTVHEQMRAVEVKPGLVVIK